MDINALLWRPVHDGKQFEKLMPKSNCKEVFTGDGMTDYSVTQMAEMVKLAHWQTAKIAPLLKKRSLQDTCKAIHAFCYNHFQYKADKALQVLRSPACSWSVRHSGIDCKSYSIIASCILTNLGITHYIRRIKQPAFEPTMWTHVYVVVPVDQKTGNLAGGYHTIDGTIATMNEPMFLQKSDLKMKHVGLMGTVPQGRAQHPQGLNGFSLGEITSKVKGLFTGGWSPSCIGGTHTGSDYTKTVEYIVPFFYNAINAVNTAINNNSPDVMQLANKVLMNAQQIKAHSNSYANHDWDSSCSRNATKGYKQLGQYYEDMALKAFLPWLQNYFNITIQDVTGIKRGGYEPKSEFTKSSFNGGSITVKQIQSMTLKPTTTAIKAFEFTPYSVERTDSFKNFNVTEFLGTLNNTLATFGVGNSNGTGNGTNIGKGGTYENIPSQPIQQAGFGVMGFLLLAGAAGMVFAGMKDKGAGAKAATTKKATK